MARPRGRDKLKHVTKEELQKLIEAGKSHSEIAEIYNVAKPSISRKAKREGIMIHEKKMYPALFAAQKLARKYKLMPPTDLELVCEQEGLHVVFSEFAPSISGMIEGNEIYINKNHSKSRQRFSLAHEMGHYFLKHNTNKHVDDTVMFRKNADSSPMEKEANLFAAELLMPKNALDEALKDKENIDTDDIESLAAEFEVSSIALSFRLQNIGYQL